MAEFLKVVPKKLFFDRKAVMSALDRGTLKALSRIGAFVRTRAKSKTGRYGTKANPTAKPGQPPRRHAGQLHDLIFFAYDPVHQAVDIGPVRFGGDDAAHLLEFGGVAVRRHYNNGKPGETYQAHYAGNPYMLPSLNEEVAAGTIAPAWKGVVKS